MKTSKLMIGGSAVALLLAACTPVDTYNADPNARTKQGALTGAAIGGLLGVATGDGGKDKLDRAVVGAALGGLGGAVVGNQLDKQAAELQSAVGASGATVVNEGSQLRVVMPEGILFAVDSASVNSAIQDELYSVAGILNRYPDSRIEVIGHTDNSGTASYNQDLSQRRAAAVGAVLRNAGVAGGRVVTYGRGEDAPIASNLTPEGRAQNRRVEILIIPTR